MKWLLYGAHRFPITKVLSKSVEADGGEVFGKVYALSSDYKKVDKDTIETETIYRKDTDRSWR